MFYLKEFLLHNKIYTICMFPCEIPKHGCNMDRPVPPPCCLWVLRLSWLTVVGLDPGCPGGPLSAPDPGGPWPLSVMLGPVLGI